MVKPKDEIREDWSVREVVPHTNGEVPLEMYQDLLAKYDALVREVLAMKRDGFVPTVTHDAAAELPKLPEAVQTTINELVSAAGGDVDLSRTLTASAWELLRGGMGETDVAHLLEQGEEVPA